MNTCVGLGEHVCATGVRSSSGFGLWRQAVWVPTRLSVTLHYFLNLFGLSFFICKMEMLTKVQASNCYCEDSMR